MSSNSRNPIRVWERASTPYVSSQPYLGRFPDIGTRASRPVNLGHYGKATKQSLTATNRIAGKWPRREIKTYPHSFAKRYRIRYTMHTLPTLPTFIIESVSMKELDAS